MAFGQKSATQKIIFAVHLLQVFSRTYQIFV